MKTIKAKLTAFISTPASAPLILLVVCVLAYGLLIPSLGFYWDDMPMSWIPYELGREKSILYFSENRPVWGELYWFTTRILPHTPQAWQVFGLLWRWLTGVALWLVMRKLWPGRKFLALGASLLFLIYPGFNQQYVSYLYAHFWIILVAFLLSFWLMLLAHEKRKRFWPLTISALLLSAANLWTLEYFYLLELTRPLILFAFLRGDSDRRQRLVRTLRAWIPYLGVFLLSLYWRVFLYKGQTTHYQFDLVALFQDNPLEAISTLGWMFFNSLWIVNLPAWLKAFEIPSPGGEGWRVFSIWIVIVSGLAAALPAALLKLQDEPAGAKQAGKWAVVAGLLVCLIAGWPFYLIGQPPSLAFPMNRFTVSFMLGASLLLAGLLEWLPVRQWVRVLVVVLVIAFSAGRQFQWADEYRRAWTAQKNLFWQMSWRMPAIQPGTMLLLNEDGIEFYSDNSLSTPLNWIYAPGNRSNDLYYMIYFPTNRLGGGNLPALEPGHQTSHDYDRVAVFHGNTSQAIVMVYTPPACLRILDPEIDPSNRLIPEIMRDAANLSSPQWIQAGEQPALPNIYAPEPPHGWCYYFEQAELARQLGDWEQVAALGDQAFALDDHPNDPVERFVFIEGYAHIGNWQTARDLTFESYRVSKNYMRPLLCRLWLRIGQDVSDAPVEEINIALNCAP